MNQQRDLASERFDGVDVLAVIRRHAKTNRVLACIDAHSAQEADALEAVEAAVARLIEMLDECVDVLRGVDSDTGDRVDCAARQGAAVLARIGGAK